MDVEELKRNLGSASTLSRVNGGATFQAVWEDGRRVSIGRERTLSGVMIYVAHGLSCSRCAEVDGEIRLPETDPNAEPIGIAFELMSQTLHRHHLVMFTG